MKPPLSNSSQGPRARPRILRRAPLVLACLTLFAVPVIAHGQASTPAAPTDQSPEVIRTTSDDNNRLTVPVSIGEAGPFPFLVDTGSQATVISDDLATRLAILPTGKASLVSMANRQVVDIVRLDGVRLGRRTFNGITAPLLKKEHIGADGILGVDSLQDQRVMLDFRKGRLAVGDARSLGGNRGYEIVVSARRKLGQLIIGEAKIGSVPVAVIVDTGSEISTGNLLLKERLKAKVGQDVSMTAVTGETLVGDLGFVRVLTLDGIDFQNVPIAFADSPTFAALGLEKRPAMFIGMRQLRGLDRVAIDFKARRVLFDLPDEAWTTSGLALAEQRP